MGSGAGAHTTSSTVVVVSRCAGTVATDSCWGRPVHVEVGQRCGDRGAHAGQHEGRAGTEFFGDPAHQRRADGRGPGDGDDEQSEHSAAHGRGRRQLQPCAGQGLEDDAARAKCGHDAECDQ